VITSNLPPRELYRGGLQRDRFLPAIALLEHDLEVLHVDGGIDYRLRQLQRRPIYLDSRATDSGAQLQALFDALAGEHGDSATELRIGGRKLRALRRRGDVVWFSFATLCQGARSPADYVDIAQEFHTVLLSDVPVFTEPHQDNEARRFIALIDELYDQGVKLVLSAAQRQPICIVGNCCSWSFAARQPPGRDADRSLPGAPAAPRVNAQPP